MGDRSQIAIRQPSKKDPEAKIYLYGHWIGADIYPLLQRVIRADQRLDDSSYLTRIIARAMGMGKDGETGYGIDNEMHGDIEHAVPVLDCDTKTITFEDPDWEHNKNPVAKDLKLTFTEFATKPPEFFEGW